MSDPISVYLVFALIFVLLVICVDIIFKDLRQMRKDITALQERCRKDTIYFAYVKNS